MEFSIRPATRDDCKDLARMLRVCEPSILTGCPYIIRTNLSLRNLEQDGFRENPFFHAFIAEVPEQHKSKDGYTKIGLAFYIFSYSMTTSRTICLQMLYVMDEFRGKGVGKALFKKVTQEGVAARCKLLHFKVAYWNKPALGFYVSQGCHDITTERGIHLMSLTRHAMERLGQS
ncbi:diamine acetyltransferase 1-like [Antennarius striatus]|uniref:diamine acetyltransferase 1-like n=1 Tax=Antennarius striatus TaxID=241820 RepID=UPI0035B25712